ncbi:MAG: nucleotidyltransferase family protein [Bacilli bacterium]|nr:nucleotidyltransferase family protein [Bacilli bacterium]
MNNIEKELILEVFKYEPDELKIKEYVTSGSINWPLVLGFVSYHRIAGLFYERFSKINVRLLDYPVFFSTYMVNQSQKIRSELQLDEIKKISCVLDKNHIKHIFLKGSVLNQLIYEPGSRASNDIDILVNKDSINKVTKILKNIGFIQGKYNYKTNTIEPFSEDELKESIIKKGETCPFVKVSNNLTIKTIDVDVNFSLDWDPNYDTNIINTILDSRIKIDIDNDSIYSANMYYNLIELCAHFYKDMALLDIVSKRKVFDLYKVLDIYYLIKKFYKNINFTELEKTISYTNSYDFVYFTLINISSLFNDFETKEITQLLKKIENRISSKNIINTIFDQYNTRIKYVTSKNIIDRFFSYNVLELYHIDSK